jgi:hypothetical protein
VTTPAFSDGVTYLLRDGHVRAVDLEAGSELWAEDADGGLRTAPLSLGDVVAVGSSSGTIFLLDAGTGSVVWSDDTGQPILQPSEHVSGVLTGLAASDDLLVVPASSRIVAYRGTRAATSTTVAAAPDPVPWGAELTLTAQVTPLAATGSVSFHADGDLTPLVGCADVPIEEPGGTATCVTASLGPGIQLIEVLYSGDADQTPSRGSVEVTVGAIPPTSISGTVTNRGTDRAHVFAIDAETSELAGSARVAADGTYEIPDIPVGSYFVYFGASHPYWGPSARSDEAWSNAHSFLGSATVDVAGLPVTGIDATLEASGRIDGRVTSGGVGVGGAVVEVTAAPDVATQNATSHVLTDNAGNFSAPGLDIGSHSIQIDWDADGDEDATSAAPIVVGAGATVDAGTFAVSMPWGAPSRPASLNASPGVGRARITYGLPSSTGASPLEVVYVGVWPGWTDLSFGAGGFDATALGLLNGVPNRVSVNWRNEHGMGPARVVDTTPTGCAYLWFTDVASSSTFCDEIRWLVYEGISEGYDDATFRPGDVVSRQAMAAFLYRFAGAPDGEDPTCSSAEFSDVPVSHAFCGEIAWLVDQGITTGFPDDSFRPSLSVSRQTMAAFLQRLEIADTVVSSATRAGVVEPIREGLVGPQPPAWTDPPPPPEPATIRIPRD